MFARLWNACQFFALACLMTTPAWGADGDVTRVVAYDGVVKLDGSDFSGEVDMTFTLHTAAADGEQLWQEVWDSDVGSTSVTVISGRFSVNLGTHTSVEAIIADGADVYLGMALRLADSVGDYSALSGRQRLKPVPFTMWNANISDLDSDGLLTVSGGLSTTEGSFTTVSGNILGRGGLVTATGNITTVAGNITAGGSGKKIAASVGHFDDLTIVRNDGVSLTSCRICTNYRNQGQHIGTWCIRLVYDDMTTAELSGPAREDAEAVQAATESGMVYVCDGGASGWQDDFVLQTRGESSNDVRGE